MILAATRWPGPAVIQAVFRWLERRGPAFGAAADAMWTFTRSGALTTPADPERILATLRATPDERISPACCAMLGWFGEDQDRERLVTLLHAPSTALRVAAARALVDSPAALDHILDAARQEPDLLDIAAQGALMHRPNRATFRQIEKLPAPSPEAHRRALLLVAPALPAPDLLDVAQSSPDDTSLRESYLTLLASPDRLLSERADLARLRAIAEGVILLARTRLAMDRPDAAVAALDGLPELADLVDHVRVTRLRAQAMLCLNRIDDAAELDAPPSVWLDALERCVNKPFAPRLAVQIEDRFSASLTDDERARLARLRDLLPPVLPAPEDVPFVGPLQPGK
jgi:hypothetical protein